MSQDLNQISPEAFELQLYKIPTRALLSLYRELLQFKWEHGRNFSHDKICDIERKDSLIQKELMKRGFLTKENRDEFVKMTRKLNFKKRRF